MTFILPRVYPITDAQLSALSHKDQVKRLIDAGAKLIQLRDKYAATRDFYQDAEAALRVARDQDVTLIINDRVDIALALKADGVHLGQTDLPAHAARRLLGDRAIIGLSTHNLEQVQVARQQPIDYIAFGPVFRTQTKEAPDPTTGLRTLKRVRHLTDLPLVAIGGISSENAPDVFAAGADAVATISSIVGEPEKIAENFHRIVPSAAI